MPIPRSQKENRGRSLRILFLLTQDLESPTGGGRVLPLARALARLGYSIQIFALHSRYHELAVEEREQIVDRICIRYLAPMHVRKRGSEKYYHSPIGLAWVAFRATLALTWAALRTEVDIVHVIKPHPMNGIAGWLATCFSRRILWVDCDDYEAGSGHFQHVWQKRGVAFFERAISRSARAITTNTTFIRTKLVGWGIPDARIFDLPNGVDPADFPAPNRDLSEFKLSLGLSGKQVVAFIGSISLVSHPINLLLEAMESVVQAEPEAALMVVGGGEDLERMRSHSVALGLADSVRFVGRAAQSDLAAYYAISTVSIDPVFDNDAARGRLPLKLFESWACGVPIITGDVGDRRRVFGNPPAGLLVNPGSAKALAKGILTLLADKPLAQTLITRGYQRLGNFTWDHLASRLDGYYNEQGFGGSD